MEKVSELSSLVKKAQKDPGAFAQLYAKTFAFSYSVVRRYLNNPQDIEDVLQTSYMYALNSLSSLRDPDNFQSWMQTILIHECQKCLRANKKFSDLLARSKDVAELEDDGRSDWTDLLEQRENYEIIRDIVDSLPNEQKMCAAMFYFEEKSVAEISDFLTVPEGTVKSRLYHVRRKVEKALKALSKQTNALFGAAPGAVLRSYFKHSEKEIAAASLRQSAYASALRENVWAAILSPGSVTRGAGRLFGLGASASGSAGLAASSGTVVTTAVKVVAVTVSAAAVVGGGISVREHIRTRPAAAGNAAVTAAKQEDSFEPFSTEAESTQTTASTTLTQPSQTAAASTTESESLVYPSTVDTTRRNAWTTRPSTVSSSVPVSTRPNSVSPTQTTAAPNTVQPAVQTTVPATVQPTAVPTTAASAYRMSGSVLSGYTGSESDLNIPSSVNGTSVTAIGSHAFEQNENIRSVQIPDTVTQIGQQAFSGCTSLKTVGLPASLRTIGAGAFDGCLSLVSVTVPNGTESIGDDAFSDCASLSQITVPSSVKSIGDNAFGGCEGLTVRCAENSEAHLYAKANSISYQLVEGI